MSLIIIAIIFVTLNLIGYLKCKNPVFVFGGICSTLSLVLYLISYYGV